LLRRFAAKTTRDPLRAAFSQRAAVHAGGGGVPIPRAGLDEELERAWATPARGPGLAYVHVPFCTTRCSYCAFFQEACHPRSTRAYAERLVEEIHATRGRIRDRSMIFDAVYLGGGTPTALEADDLRRLLAALGTLPSTNDCEITVETSVVDLDAEKIRACLEHGVNRFSVGVQTFDSRIRRSLGRRADDRRVFEMLRELVAHQRAAVVIDLLVGLPGQNESTFMNDLRLAHGLGLDGIDLYELILLPNTPLARRVASDEEERLAPRGDAPRLFSRGVHYFHRHGVRRLTVGHWAYTPRERSVYNQRVKAGAEIVPFGCGAGGSIADLRIMNARDIATYDALSDDGRAPVIFGSRSHPRARLFAEITAGMETLHLDIFDLAKRHEIDLVTLFEPLVEQWRENGLVYYAGGVLSSTTAGQFWTVTLARALIEGIELLEAVEGEPGARVPSNRGSAEGGRA
jgi:oxygen-independent coproporphyrinogen-3 oxidase